MPNWCLNRLTIEHDDVEKVNEFVEAYKRMETCEHYLPTPKVILMHQAGYCAVTDRDQEVFRGHCGMTQNSMCKLRKPNR